MAKTEKRRRAAYRPQRILLYGVDQRRGSSTRRLSETHTSQDVIPKLARSLLHRCLQCHGISRMPASENKTKKKNFKSYPTVFFNIDITKAKNKEGKPYLFVVNDRTSKFVMTKLFPQATMASARLFLKNS